MYRSLNLWQPTLVLLLISSVHSVDAADKYALLIAVTKYQHTEMNKPALEFPEIDAKELAEIFKSSGYMVELLLGKSATQAEITKKLGTLKKQGDTDGVVVLGLFGHGVEFEGTNEACFCAYDSSLRDAIDSKGKKLLKSDGTPLTEPDPDSLVKMGDLLSALRLSAAGNRVLLADCCRNSPNRARGRAFGANLKLTDLPDNTAALFACSANEQAFEHRDWGHGAFTKCLIDELRAEVGAGPVTAGALADRLRPRVKQLVASISEGRNTQTTNFIVRDYVDLQLSNNFTHSNRAPTIMECPVTDEKAKAAQQAWADHIKSPVMQTNGLGMKMMLVPPGRFKMGSSPKETNHGSDETSVDALISRAFRISECEVTQAEWQSVMQSTPSRFNGKLVDSKNPTGTNAAQRLQLPVESVSWFDAVAFCNSLSLKEGHECYYSMSNIKHASNGILSADVSVTSANGYRLPTEAQWEYACRAGTETAYAIGNDRQRLDDRAWYEDTTTTSRPVRGKIANAWGLADMHGNVSEWCFDWYAPQLTGGSEPSGPEKGSVKVARGGSWDKSAGDCRSASRNAYSADFRDASVGFRVVLGVSY